MPDIELYAAMSTLRAVRRLKPDPVPDDVLRRVLEAATWAPTGGNAQPWRIVAVRDRAKIRRIGELYAKTWNGYAGQSRKSIAAAPEPTRVRVEKMLGAGDYLAEHFDDVPVVAVFCFNPSQMAITDAGQDRPSVVGGGSVYPSVQNLLLACRAEGLGCVLTTLLCMEETEIRSLLKIPDDWYTCAHIPIGYPVLKGHGPISRRPIEKLAYADVWDEPFVSG